MKGLPVVTKPGNDMEWVTGENGIPCQGGYITYLMESKKGNFPWGNINMRGMECCLIRVTLMRNKHDNHKGKGMLTNLGNLTLGENMTTIRVKEC